METNPGPESSPCPPLIGVSENIKKVRELIDLVAECGFNIIITGETGVGKDVAARNLYCKSPRKARPFVKINCAALPEGLLESELFGYEKGAFTGAAQRRRGKFELAHGGVLFLDEIGDMPLSLQSKLLHVLQAGEFSPLGSENDLKTDTWIIAATNHDLEKRIEKKQFREDLFYRLNIINVHLSPLRERPEDIPCLIDFFMKEYKGRFTGNTDLHFSEELVKKMQEHRWPGNVRELLNVLKRMMVVGDPETIMEELLCGKHLPLHPASTGATVRFGSTMNGLFDLTGIDPSNPEKSIPLKEIKKHAVAMIEKEVIERVLEKTEWNRSRAARILKVSYRTMLNKIKEFELESFPVSDRLGRDPRKSEPRKRPEPTSIFNAWASPPPVYDRLGPNSPAPASTR